MTTAAPQLVTPSPVTPLPSTRTVADLLRDLGDIPAHRVRLVPTPGTATEPDCVRVTEKEWLCELIDGTLVEKTVGTRESFLASAVLVRLWGFVTPRRLGMVTGADGMYRMIRGNIREPDVSFTLLDRVALPLPQVGGWCPDLCVEVLSPDNSRAEMAQKRDEYFAAGCRLVWEINPRTRTAEVFTSATDVTRFDDAGTLDGGEVLPGFTLPLRDLFGELEHLNPS